MKIYFSDFFNVSPETLEKYGAFNISLVNDLPLFIDPFLLFGSKKQEYQILHKGILQYISFLKDQAENNPISQGLLSAWYSFPEVKENWLGYSLVGNSGRGLGKEFGEALRNNISLVFSDINREEHTQSSHLEELSLFKKGVGKDCISDFTSNLIKDYLLSYTERFAKEYIAENQLKQFLVKKAVFNYDVQRWMPKKYTLPCYDNHYVILTPKDILTKDDTWINSHDMIEKFDDIVAAIDNDEQRALITAYFKSKIPVRYDHKPNTDGEITEAKWRTIEKYPIIAKLFVKLKEDNSSEAFSQAAKNVSDIEETFITQVADLVAQRLSETDFYKYPATCAYDEALKRVHYMKQVIEANDGYRFFYSGGKPIKKEEHLQLIYRLTWYASDYDVNREVNNGRGPVDYKVSKSAKNSALVEFKLASNTKLKRNLERQLTVYNEANPEARSICVIMYFTDNEKKNLEAILKELNLDALPNVIKIDARKKVSGSNA